MPKSGLSAFRFHLENTIYPSYDAVYKEISKSKTGYVGNIKKKRSHFSHYGNSKIHTFYNKIVELVTMTASLIR